MAEESLAIICADSARNRFFLLQMHSGCQEVFAAHSARSEA